MKLKNGIVWLCVVVILAGEIFLFSANRQKETAQAALREAKHEVEQLRSQLDQLKNSSVATLSAENARLRKENQELSQKNSQLQKENSQWHGTNQQLAQQLETVRATVQQQQDQLQQSEADKQQAVVAAQQTQTANERNACINNLRQIDAAKQQWALENNKTADAVPTAPDLLFYFRDVTFPVCPAGGTYTIGAVGELPACSIPGHVLPQ